MNKSSSRWIQPRQDVGSFSNNSVSSSKSLTMTSKFPTCNMSDRAMYPKTSPATLRNISSSSPLGPQGSRNSSITEILTEAPIHEGSEGGGHRRVQRQSHTKSRTGCFNCKKRRIKCEENRPSCTQCAKRRLRCEWPDLQFRDGRSAVEVGYSSHSVPAQPQPKEAAFNMQDFRLFYHFIEKAYPHHPIGNDSVWTHEIASISYNHDYLMHAMLGLSASDLKEKGPETSELTCSAMSHRVQAIKSLNTALSNGLHTFEQGNAMLATCYVLVFQSVLLGDGLAEYMTFVRGCVLIAQNMGCKRMKFLFHSFLGMDAIEKMNPHLKEAPEVNPQPVNAGVVSLEAFKHLCEIDYQKEFHQALLKTAKALYTSSRNAYLSLTQMYGIFAYSMSHEDFQQFIDPANEVGQLLQAHFVTVQLLLSPITVREMGDRKPDDLEDPKHHAIRWLDAIFQRVTPRVREYFEWPMSVAEDVQKGSFYSELTYNSPNAMQEEDDMSQYNND